MKARRVLRHDPHDDQIVGYAIVQTWWPGEYYRITTCSMLECDTFERALRNAEAGLDSDEPIVERFVTRIVRRSRTALLQKTKTICYEAEYPTREEAQTGHERVIEKLATGRGFEAEPALASTEPPIPAEAGLPSVDCPALIEPALARAECPVPIQPSLFNAELLTPAEPALVSTEPAAPVALSLLPTDRPAPVELVLPTMDRAAPVEPVLSRAELTTPATPTQSSVEDPVPAEPTFPRLRRHLPSLESLARTFLEAVGGDGLITNLGWLALAPFATITLGRHWNFTGGGWILVFVGLAILRLWAFLVRQRLVKWARPRHARKTLPAGLSTTLKEPEAL